MEKVDSITIDLSQVSNVKLVNETNDNERENDPNSEKNLIINRRINMVYGKNGTGKSSIANAIKEQFSNHYDVRVFDGFSGVIKDQQDLGLVVLGDENADIDNKINDIKKEIDGLIKEKENKRAEVEEIEETRDDSIIRKYNSILKKKKDIEGQKDKLLKDIAKETKDAKDPWLVPTSYNVTTLRNELIDIEKKENITDEKQDTLKAMLKTEMKIAPDLGIEDYDFQQYLDKVNAIIKKNINETIIIPRFEGANKEKKIKFAKDGLDLHDKNGDICVFCGNKVTRDTINELEKYFTQEDISNFQNELKELENDIEEKRKKIINYSIPIDSFYPKYNNDIKIVNENLEKRKAEIDLFLKKLKDKVNEKNTNITGKVDIIETEVPSLKKEIQDYDKIRNENNAINLTEQQEDARNQLKCQFVKKLLEQKKYYDIEGSLKKIQDQLYPLEELKNSKEKEIHDLTDKIARRNSEIRELQEQTRNEEKLAQNINKELDGYVSFELVKDKNDRNGGCYRIKDKKTGLPRSVVALSTGEKNIIAFLYFCEKIKEISANNKKKIIIFDDPMNSNDDTMQYIIMEKLLSLIVDKREIIEKNNIEYLFIMTHNNYFFLNITEKFRRNKKNHTYYYFVKDKEKTKIVFFDEKFIKTAYDGVWYEMKVIYNNKEADSRVLANIMRRILETFISFTKQNKDNFYDKVIGIKKYLDVNSHIVDDAFGIESDLSPLSKEELLELFKKLFVKNGFEEHFKSHWEEQQSD